MWHTSQAVFITSYFYRLRTISLAYRTPNSSSKLGSGAVRIRSTRVRGSRGCGERNHQTS